MKTIGAVLKEARVRKRYSKVKLAEETKIKAEYINAIEKEDWQALPEYPVIQGFVKGITTTLKLDSAQIMAFLRRDYPPRALRINPKPDVSDKFAWTPRFTFIVGAVLVSLTILGYLAFQYINFISPPKLEVFQPTNEQIVTESTLRVIGKTDSDAVIRVNNQPVLLDENGEFLAEITIIKDTNEIEIKSTSRSGKETVIYRTIKPKLE